MMLITSSSQCLNLEADNVRLLRFTIPPNVFQV